MPAKRSAQLRSEKIKFFGLIEDSLMEADILFLNSLTATQILEIGKTCGMIFEPWQQMNPIEKLKVMEIQRCGVTTGQVLDYAAKWKLATKTIAAACQLSVVSAMFWYTYFTFCTLHLFPSHM